jgi:NACHT domain
MCMLKASGRRWGPWTVACGATVGALLLLGVAFRRNGLAGLTDIATLVALFPAAVTLVLWAWKASRDGAPPAGEQLEQARQTLAGKVREQWLHEASVRQLHDPDPMPVIWRLTERPIVDLSEGVAAADMLAVAGDTGRAAELARRFRKLEKRRLVIIGDRGMGKTTLAILLVLEFLKADRPMPVPVLFSLASFDDGYKDLDSWLIAMLGREYPWLAASHGPGAAAALVRQRWVLPVLDGLDELADAARPAVIDALNRALGDGELEVILTCRTAEYAAAVRSGDLLRAAAVIEPEPVRGRDLPA